MARWMGVDLGTRRIGLSLSDDKGTVATPYATLDRTSDEHDARAIAEIAGAEQVREVVLGHPLRLDGTRGDAAFVIEAFAERLKAAGVRVRLFDERFTTVEAEKKLRKGGVRAKQQRTRVDKAAATVLLQAFLDTRKP